MPEKYLPYSILGPRMDKSVPANQVNPGAFGHLAGIDGRFMRCLRKYFGNRKVLDLRDITGGENVGTYSGPSFFKYVSFKKYGTSDIYRGFVVRWDSLDSTTDQQVDLFYTLDNGTTWAVHSIWATGNSITASAEMDCSSDEQYLFVCVKGKDAKTVYWDGSALQTVDMGPGDFSATIAALTQSGSAVKTDDYQLAGNGVYQVAWRFYDSKRGIYSALSDPVTVRNEVYKTSPATGSISFLSGGGDSGKMVEGDTISIVGRSYRYVTAGADVTIPVATYDSIAGHCAALADAINGDASSYVTAVAGENSVQLTSNVRGSDGNNYGISISEVAPSQDDLEVSGTTLSGGGNTTTEPETGCKVTMDFPANGSVLAGKTFTDFDLLFDTVDIFRTINLGSSSLATSGAVFYLEQSIAKTGNWENSGTWDALTVDIGTVMDEALPFYTIYDPQKDIVETPPQSGVIERYSDITFMADGYDIVFSSMEQTSAEYFTTYNRRFGNEKEGEPLRCIATGDAMFLLCPAAIIHVYKTMTGKPLQFTRIHRQRGLAAKGGAHAVGNSVLLLSGLHLSLLNANDGSMGNISTLNRLLEIDWVNDIADIESGYDSLMDASFFLNSNQNQMAIVWHSTQMCTILEGANFVSVSEGLDITTGKKVRAYFITSKGVILSPDYASAGSGTMLDVADTYTLNGTATSTGTTLTDTTATFDSGLVGAMVYMASGLNAGDGREISSVSGTTLTFLTNFDHTITRGDRYAVSPVPVKIRAWKLQEEGVDAFTRWKMTGMAISAGELDGFTDNPNNKFRVSAYRGNSSTPQSNSAEIRADNNTSLSAEALNIDGVDVMPYVEQISSGTMFEITDIEVGTSYTGSKKIGD